jgi:hypothetical protein
VQSENFNPLYPPPPPAPIWHLPVAISLWAVSIFLVLQAAADLKWATKDEADAPDHRAGIALAWVLTASIILLFYLNDINYDSPQDPFLYLLRLATLPFRKPEAFSEALLFSSLPIGILAAFKFSMGASLVRSVPTTPSALTRSPQALLAAGLFTLLQLAGSIASLIALFR